MEQSLKVPAMELTTQLEPPEDVEEITRKRAQSKARRTFRIVTSTIVAMSRLSNDLRHHIVVEVEAKALEQAESDIIAGFTLGVQQSSEELVDTGVHSSLEESVDASTPRSQGLCTTYPEAEWDVIPLPDGTDFGSLFSPNQGYIKSEPEESGRYGQAEQEMFTLPNACGGGSNSILNQTHPSSEREESGQHEQAMPNIRNFRIVTRTVVDRGLFRFVLEFEAEKLEQVERQIIAAFVNFEVQSSSEEWVDACITGNEGLCRTYPEAEQELIPLPNASYGCLSIPNQGYFTKEPEVEEEMITLPNTTNYGSFSIPSPGYSTAERENNVPDAQAMSKILAELDDQSEELVPDFVDARRHQGIRTTYPEADRDTITRPSATVDGAFSISKRGHPTPERGDSGRYEKSPIAASGFRPSVDYLMSGCQVAQEQNTSYNWMDTKEGWRGNLYSILEDDGIQSGRDFGKSEQCGSLDFDQQLKLLQNGKLKELMSQPFQMIMEKFEETNASYRLEVQNLKSEAYETSRSLKREVNQLKENLICRFNEITSSVVNFSKRRTDIQKWLPKAVSRIIDMCNGDLCHLLQNTDRISGTLGKIEEQRELLMAELFRNCTSSIYLLVESFLEKHN